MGRKNGRKSKNVMIVSIIIIVILAIGGIAYWFSGSSGNKFMASIAGISPGNFVNTFTVAGGTSTPTASYKCNSDTCIVFGSMKVTKSTNTAGTVQRCCETNFAGQIGGVNCRDDVTRFGIPSGLIYCLSFDMSKCSSIQSCLQLYKSKCIKDDVAFDTFFPVSSFYISQGRGCDSYCGASALISTPSLIHLDLNSIKIPTGQCANVQGGVSSYSANYNFDVPTRVDVDTYKAGGANNVYNTTVLKDSYVSTDSYVLYMGDSVSFAPRYNDGSNTPVENFSITVTNYDKTCEKAMKAGNPLVCDPSGSLTSNTKCSVFHVGPGITCAGRVYLNNGDWTCPASQYCTGQTKTAVLSSDGINYVNCSAWDTISPCDGNKVCTSDANGASCQCAASPCGGNEILLGTNSTSYKTCVPSSSCTDWSGNTYFCPATQGLPVNYQTVPSLNQKQCIFDTTDDCTALNTNKCNSDNSGYYTCGQVTVQQSDTRGIKNINATKWGAAFTACTGGQTCGDVGNGRIGCVCAGNTCSAGQWTIVSADSSQYQVCVADSLGCYSPGANNQCPKANIDGTDVQTIVDVNTKTCKLPSGYQTCDSGYKDICVGSIPDHCITVNAGIYSFKILDPQKDTSNDCSATNQLCSVNSTGYASCGCDNQCNQGESKATGNLGTQYLNCTQNSLKCWSYENSATVTCPTGLSYQQNSNGKAGTCLLAGGQVCPSNNYNICQGTATLQKCTGSTVGGVQVFNYQNIPCSGQQVCNDPQTPTKGGASCGCVGVDKCNKNGTTGDIQCDGPGFYKNCIKDTSQNQCYDYRGTDQAVTVGFACNTVNGKGVLVKRTDTGCSPSDGLQYPCSTTAKDTYGNLLEKCDITTDSCIQATSDEYKAGMNDNTNVAFRCDGNIVERAAKFTVTRYVLGTNGDVNSDFNYYVWVPAEGASDTTAGVCNTNFECRGQGICTSKFTVLKIESPDKVAIGDTFSNITVSFINDVDKKQGVNIGGQLYQNGKTAAVATSARFPSDVNGTAIINFGTYKAATAGNLTLKVYSYDDNGDIKYSQNKIIYIASGLQVKLNCPTIGYVARQFTCSWSLNDLTSTSQVSGNSVVTILDGENELNADSGTLTGSSLGFTPTKQGTITVKVTGKSPGYTDSVQTSLITIQGTTDSYDFLLGGKHVADYGSNGITTGSLTLEINALTSGQASDITSIEAVMNTPGGEKTPIVFMQGTDGTWTSSYDFKTGGSTYRLTGQILYSDPNKAPKILDEPIPTTGTPTKDLTMLIIEGIAGGVVFLIAIIVVIVLLSRKKKGRR